MTVRDFYSMLFGEFNESEFSLYYGEQLSAKEADTKPLEKRTAAYMVYVFISQVKKEADEPSIEPAFVLKDIYECPACIRYVAQVYLKGIMTAKDRVFGVREKVEEEEAAIIISRAFDRSKRFGGK